MLLCNEVVIYPYVFKALEDGTLEETEEHAKSTKRKRKSGKKDDDPDVVMDRDV